MFVARPLDGLPVYGPPALSFPTPGAFREGFVVEFELAGRGSWVGNFAKWDDNHPNAVFSDLGSSAVVVIAGGEGYIIDAEKRQLIREIGFDLQHIWFDSGLQAVVVSNGLRFEAFDAHRIFWQTRRISWDGLRTVERVGLSVTGEALDIPTDQWLPFRLDLQAGEVVGGSDSAPN